MSCSFTEVYKNKEFEICTKIISTSCFLRESQGNHCIRLVIPHHRYHCCLGMTPNERDLVVNRKGTDVASPEAQLHPIKNQIWLWQSQGGLINVSPSLQNMVLPVELHLWFLIFYGQVPVRSYQLPQVVQ